MTQINKINYLKPAAKIIMDGDILVYLAICKYIVSFDQECLTEIHGIHCPSSNTVGESSIVYFLDNPISLKMSRLTFKQGPFCPLQSQRTPAPTIKCT